MKEAASFGGLFFLQRTKKNDSLRHFAGYEPRERGRRPQNNANYNGDGCGDLMASNAR